MNIIKAGFRIVARVLRFSDRARQFFYRVTLMGHRCPKCGGALAMVREGCCRCECCRHAFDPTAAFQACTACGGKLKLVVRRYHCARCGTDASSRFLFEGLAFDADYFRQKMAESRKRRQAKREELRKLLAESRSTTLALDPADLASVPGLTEALNGLAEGLTEAMQVKLRRGFDLRRYQSHLQAHIRTIPLAFEDLPPLEEDARLDRIWRFIAMLFLANDGHIRIWQDGPDIMMVINDETDREGQDLSGDLEEADGLEGSVGRAEAW